MTEGRLLNVSRTAPAESQRQLCSAARVPRETTTLSVSQSGNRFEAAQVRNLRVNECSRKGPKHNVVKKLDLNRKNKIIMKRCCVCENQCVSVKPLNWLKPGAVTDIGTNSTEDIRYFYISQARVCRSRHHTWYYKAGMSNSLYIGRNIQFTNQTALSVNEMKFNYTFNHWDVSMVHLRFSSWYRNGAVVHEINISAWFFGLKIEEMCEITEKTLIAQCPDVPVIKHEKVG